VQSARKFSAVFGTRSAKSSITTRPAGWPPIEISKKTLGFPPPLKDKRENEVLDDFESVFVKID
jgi:hypothetical protein